MKRFLLLATGLTIVTGCSSSPPADRENTSQTQLFIYVDGEVRNPGKIVWTNGMTLQDAVSAAGGFTDFAPHKLQLKHGDKKTVFKLGPGWTFTNNPPVQPGDHIYSPRMLF